MLDEIKQSPQPEASLITTRWSNSSIYLTSGTVGPYSSMPKHDLSPYNPVISRKRNWDKRSLSHLAK